MKKVSALPLLLCLALTISACGGRAPKVQPMASSFPYPEPPAMVTVHLILGSLSFLLLSQEMTLKSHTESLHQIVSFVVPIVWELTLLTILLSLSWKMEFSE